MCAAGGILLGRFHEAILNTSMILGNVNFKVIKYLATLLKHFYVFALLF